MGVEKINPHSHFQALGSVLLYEDTQLTTKNKHNTHENPTWLTAHQLEYKYKNSKGKIKCLLLCISLLILPRKGRVHRENRYGCPDRCNVRTTAHA